MFCTFLFWFKAGHILADSAMKRTSYRLPPKTSLFMLLRTKGTLLIISSHKSSTWCDTTWSKILMSLFLIMIFLFFFNKLINVSKWCIYTHTHCFCITHVLFTADIKHYLANFNIQYIIAWESECDIVHWPLKQFNNF